ncbi:aldo/keto reductase [Streptomyces mirabilis]|uniref:aldo/keto reductase n=1 Tax=Streptomyces mirabilis TaxID=68239 RepID=UPI0036D8F9C4
MPADASSLTLPALDQLRESPQVGPEEVPGLLERLAGVPDPRDPRGVRHRLAIVLALTACAVLAGATSLLALAWVLRNPLVSAPIVGATKPHHLQQAVDALDLQLSNEEVAALQAPYTSVGPSWF